MEFALPIVFALFLWWFSTGAILFLDGLPRSTFPWSFAVISLVCIGGFIGAAISSHDQTAFGAYLGFVSGLAVWAWHETTFLLGYVTGPRRVPCTAMRFGWERLRQAIATILHHELAILVAGILLLVITADGSNRTALWTFLILWAMRQSAKLNLFLGVRNLSAEFLPSHLKYIATYLARRPMNLLFPVSVTVSTIVTAWLAHAMVAAPSGSPEGICAALLTTLMALAVLEHWFLVLPIPFARLWDWGFASRGSLELERCDTGSDAADWSAHVPRCVDARSIHMLVDTVASGGFGRITTFRGRVMLDAARWIDFDAAEDEERVAELSMQATQNWQPWLYVGWGHEKEATSGELQALRAALADCEQTVLQGAIGGAMKGTHVAAA